MSLHRSTALALCAAALACAPSSASAGWDPPESTPATGDGAASVWAAPSTGYARGFTLNGSYRIAERPFGGTLGPILALPDQAGKNGADSLVFDAAGNALVGNRFERTITYRAASVGGGTGTTQVMPAGVEPKAISMLPTGEALVALGTNPSGPVQVAFRPAGSAAQFNLAPAAVETFSANGTVIGLQFQPDGGAIVVWREGNTIRQAVRPAGAASFGAPADVPDPPGVSATKSAVIYSSRPSGAAMLTYWTTPDQKTAYAAVRPPGGSFGPARAIATAGVTLVNVLPAVTDNGDGLAIWTERRTTDCLATAPMGATYHAGTWSAPFALGPTGGPTTSQPSGVPVSGTTDVAVPMQVIEDQGTPCSFGDDKRGLDVHHFRAGPAGLVDQGTSTVVARRFRAPNQTPNVAMESIAMAPDGRILAKYAIDATRWLVSFDGELPVAGASPPASTPVPISAPAGPTTPGASTPPVVLPLVARGYVILKALDPNAPAVTLDCTLQDAMSGDCAVKIFAKALLQRGKGKARAAAAAKPTTIATARATVKAGSRRKVALKLNAAGRRLVARGKAAKVTVDVTVTRGGRTGTVTLRTTLKAKKRR